MKQEEVKISDLRNQVSSFFDDEKTKSVPIDTTTFTVPMGFVYFLMLTLILSVGFSLLVLSMAYELSHEYEKTTRELHQVESRLIQIRSTVSENQARLANLRGTIDGCRNIKK